MERREKKRSERKKLPIGIQSFEKIRDGEYCYADKTEFIFDLIEKGVYYFLSRPRRFGKSLLVDTMDCLFSGRRELFDGLYIEDKWDWSGPNPVLKVDWSKGPVKSPDQLEALIDKMIDAWEDTYGLKRTGGSHGGRFYDLVENIAEKTRNKVVVLIDEYDKPILDHIDDPETAVAMRDVLKGFYGSFKPLDKHLRFLFLTGVSKFAKTGIFSGLNNLEDITLDSEFSAICGYTENNLETVFTDYYAGFDLNEVREWYNGYSWCGEGVYNPFDILLLFKKRKFESWWFETGTPSFLVKLFGKNPLEMSRLDNLETGEALLGSYEPESPRIETLLFQSGYLTVKSYISNSEVGTIYTLGYPNREVRQALNVLFLTETMVPGNSDVHTSRIRLYRIIEERDLPALENYLRSFMSSVPHDWHRNNPVAEYEGYYSSLIYSLFAGLGYDIVPEDTTSYGRIDLALRHKRAVWIIEVKTKSPRRKDDGPGTLQQIRERRYADKYRDRGLPIILLGLTFNKESRELENFEWEEAI